MPIALRIASAALAAGLALGAAAEEPLLWIEAEKPTAQHDIVANPGLNKTNPYAFSGGAWLSSFSEKDMAASGTADYAIEVPTAGTYHLWVRAAIGTGLCWRVDEAKDWTAIDPKKAVDPEATSIDGNNGWPPEMSWVEAGVVELSAGKHTLGLLLGGPKKPNEKSFAGVDCLVLAAGTFTPRGKYKPGDQAPPQEVYDVAPGHGWDFTPARDSFDPAALLDLRSLNEDVAGEHGFIRLSDDGNSFVRGDGQPIRFWAVDEGCPGEMDALIHHARFLAKRGVNICRLHTAMQPKQEGSQVTDIDESTLEHIHKHVAAMKSAGIYCIISPYWGTSAIIRKSWGTVADPGVSAEPLLFFEPTLQKGYKAWLKELYTRPNQYDPQKLRLADDPAVAIIQLQNENSLLFWGLGNLRNGSLLLFRQRYAEFLIRKYGSLEQARAAWHDYSPSEKDLWVPMEWDKGLPGVMHPWDFTAAGMAKKGAWPGYLECSSDQLEFMTTLMRDFNADIVKYLRDELGCKQLTNAGNWRGVDAVTEQDAEYYSYTSTDVIAKNRYTGGYHRGANDGWQVVAGSYYSNMSLIKEPVELPINIKQPLGHPVMIPETSWVQPNLYQSEAPLMVAANASLTGIDMAFWFSITSPEWTDSTIYKWSFDLPLFLGQLPANALIYRMGMVREGKPVVIEQRALADMWTRRTPLISEESGWDPNRDLGNMATRSSVKTTVDPLAYFVGPVQSVLGGDPSKSVVADLSPYVDRDAKTVRSETGEISTDYGRGIYRVDTPRAQAVAGFLKDGGPQRLTDVEVRCGNAYATVVTVAMDGKPIAQSGKILVQIGTVSRPTGWVARPATICPNGTPMDAFRLLAPGHAPYRIENAEITLTVANAAITRAVALDANGMATHAVELSRAGGKATISLPADALYVVLDAAAAK
jgi:hypothetical protein